MLFCVTNLKVKFAVFPNKESTKVRALIKLQRAIPTYLYIGKNVDSNVLSRVETENLTASIVSSKSSYDYSFSRIIAYKKQIESTKIYLDGVKQEF